MPYPLRTVPWWTDESTRFLANLLKWYPGVLQRRPTVFEVGSGNSTFFFLGKGASVVSVEVDDGYIQHVKGVVESAGYKCRVSDAIVGPDPDYDLTLVKPSGSVGQSSKPGSCFDSLAVANTELKFDFLVNDGIDRMHFLSKFRSCPESIVILDNCEYAANWGLITQSSAKPDLITVYREFLRSSDWDRVIFEQPEGRQGRSSADVTGWESITRQATAIAWGRDHLLARLMVSNLGFPLVNEDGLDNQDLATLGKRCPFDWDTMQWTERDLHRQLEDGAFYPRALDLGLERGYN